MKEKDQSVRLFIYDMIFLILGILFASFGLRSFLVPNHFLDGGITGISLLVYEATHWPLGLLLILFNIPFIIICFRVKDKVFAWRTLFSVVGVAICLQFIPFPELVHDKLLVATFGGFFLGIGVGLSMRGNGSFDGIEVLALLTLKRSPFNITEIILAINILIFIIASFFLSFETAFYAVLTYFVAGQSTKYVIEGIEAYTGVTIISSESEAIKKTLVLNMNKGITVYKGERGFMHDDFDISTECDIIFTVVTRLEVQKLRNLIYEIDPKAFVFTHTIRDTQGGILKQIVKH